MNEKERQEMMESIDKSITEAVRQHSIQIGKLTEQQVVSVIKQIAASGDLQIHIVNRPDNVHQQGVVYLPYAREQELEAENQRLRDWIRTEAERTDVCTFSIFGKICDGCRCDRKPQFYEQEPNPT